MVSRAGTRPGDPVSTTCLRLVVRLPRLPLARTGPGVRGAPGRADCLVPGTSLPARELSQRAPGARSAQAALRPSLPAPGARPLACVGQLLRSGGGARGASHGLSRDIDQSGLYPPGCQLACGNGRVLSAGKPESSRILPAVVRGAGRHRAPVGMQRSAARCRGRHRTSLPAGRPTICRGHGDCPPGQSPRSGAWPVPAAHSRSHRRSPCRLCCGSGRYPTLTLGPDPALGARHGNAAAMAAADTYPSRKRHCSPPRRPSDPWDSGSRGRRAGRSSWTAVLFLVRQVRMWWAARTHVP